MIYLFTIRTDELDNIHYFYEINNDRYITLCYYRETFDERQLFSRYIDGIDIDDNKIFTISKEDSNILSVDYKLIDISYLENYMLTKILEKL